MHGVNLDLLRTLPHSPDGRAKDPHAHHRAGHLQELKAKRLARWQSILIRLRRPFRSPATTAATADAACP